MKLGILGCGDFLRWQEEPLQASERVQVKLLPEPRDPFQALMEDLFGSGVEAVRLRALLGDLARLAAHLRPLLDAVEHGAGSLTGPQLRAPGLSSQG